MHKQSVTNCTTIYVLCILLVVFLYSPQPALWTIHLASHTDARQCDVCLLHGKNCEEQKHGQQPHIETGQTQSAEVLAAVVRNVHPSCVVAAATSPATAGWCVQLLQAAPSASAP